jgi:hypothetical protein
MPKLRAGWGCQDVLTPFTTDPQALRLEPILVLKLSLKVFPGFVIIGREPLLFVVEVWGGTSLKFIGIAGVSGLL